MELFSLGLNVKDIMSEKSHLPRTIINVYLEMPILFILIIVTQEGKQILAWNLWQFYSYIYNLSIE